MRAPAANFIEIPNVMEFATVVWHRIATGLPPYMQPLVELATVKLSSGREYVRFATVKFSSGRASARFAAVKPSSQGGVALALLTGVLVQGDEE